MNRTEKLEEAFIEQALYEESHHEPRYPIVEKPEAAQLGKTALEFTQYDDQGNYMEVRSV